MSVFWSDGLSLDAWGLTHTDILTLLLDWKAQLCYYISCTVATWPSGKAEDCKSFIPGSNPGVASKVIGDAGVAELADARDLKSLGKYFPCGFESHPRHQGQRFEHVLLQDRVASSGG